MEIRYQQVISDYYNAYRYVSKKLFSTTKWRYLATASGGIFGFLLAIGAISIAKYYEKYSFLPKAELSFGIGAIVIGTILLIAGLRIYIIKARPLIFDVNGIYLASQSFKIEENHLFHQLGDTQHIYPWNNIRQVDKTQDYIFVFIDRCAALYIPRHGFSSEDEYNEFYKKLNLHAQ